LSVSKHAQAEFVLVNVRDRLCGCLYPSALFTGNRRDYRLNDCLHGFDVVPISAVETTRLFQLTIWRRIENSLPKNVSKLRTGHAGIVWPRVGLERFSTGQLADDYWVESRVTY
jgi:hypothetical protein